MAAKKTTAKPKAKKVEKTKKSDVMNSALEEPAVTVSDVKSVGQVITADKEDIVEMFKKYQHPEKYVKGTPSKIKVENAKEAAASMIYATFGDYVYRIAKNKFGMFLDRNQDQADDIIQCGWAEFFKAADDFDPSRSSASTYFYYPTMHGMYRMVNEGILQYSSERAKGNATKCREAIEKLQKEGITSPNVCDIAYETGLGVAVVRKTLLSRERVASQISLQDEGVAECPDPYSVTPDKIMVEDEQKAVLKVVINRMMPSDLHKRILCHKWGVLGYEELSDSQLSKKFRLPIDQISRYEAAAIQALKNSSQLTEYWRTGVQGRSLQAALHSNLLMDTHESAGLAMLGMINDALGCDLEEIAV